MAFWLAPVGRLHLRRVFVDDQIDSAGNVWSAIVLGLPRVVVSFRSYCRCLAQDGNYSQERTGGDFGTRMGRQFEPIAFTFRARGNRPIHQKLSHARFCFCHAPFSRQPAQLSACLAYLRASYSYCMFCACQFNGPQDLQESCPGPSRDDHAEEEL